MPDPRWRLSSGRKVEPENLKVETRLPSGQQYFWRVLNLNQVVLGAKSRQFGN